jgi:hypothetical protein
MLNINPDKLLQASVDAFDKAATAPKDIKRWQNAIARAWQELQSNVFIEWVDGSLLILSPSNEIYEANGTCQCHAYLRGYPCWHRAAARIVQRVLETSH